MKYYIQKIYDNFECYMSWIGTPIIKEDAPSFNNQKEANKLIVYWLDNKMDYLNIFIIIREDQCT